MVDGALAFFRDDATEEAATLFDLPGVLSRLFTPCYRLGKSRNRSTGGVGLGLTAAQTIVIAHGGEIALRNRPEGGLEARVILPIMVD